MEITYKKHILTFSFNAGTSRGSLQEKTSYIIKIKDGKKIGYGEISLIPKLSPDDIPSLPDIIEKVIKKISNHSLPTTNKELHDLLENTIASEYPAVIFGFETAFLDLMNGGKQQLFNTKFTEGRTGIDINGLIWMGDESFMLEQIAKKLSAGFKCLKMKIGAIDYKKELKILQSIRNQYSKDQLILRVDANGSFNKNEVLSVLKDLKALDIHSIEQPIKAGQLSEMAELCQFNITPIALDEELIGVNDKKEKIALLTTIKPQYIILKPSLIGGLHKTSEWIEIAHDLNIGWWITSALEGNIGLNAIAQFTAYTGYSGHQGLGTGQLFTNNTPSPLEIRGEQLWHNTSNKWKL